MNKIVLFVLCTLSVGFSLVAAKEKIVVCYYGTWATYRNGQGKFDVSNVNTDLCTHVIYTFVGINEVGTIISLDPYLDLPDNWGRNNFGLFNALKDQNSNLKTLLAVGGWNEGSAKYSIMAANPTYRNNFVTSATEMVLKYGFDGFDVDWEYPNRRDSINGAADIDNFTQLLKELREAFDKHGLLLSAAVSAVESTASLSYDIPSISQYLDIVNLMAYDMYGAWDAVTGHNAPLHKGEGDENVAKENLYTVDVALEYWLQQGCPPEKLVLGVPLYGRTFQLTNANDNGVRAPSSGSGIAGSYTATNGFIGYNEFCQKLATESWELHYDSLAKVPYAVQGSNWVSYDDADSLIAKIEYALQYDIAGIMVWSIETDDFHGICNSEVFPLLRAINKALEKSTGTSTIVVPSSTVTVSSSAVPSSTVTTSSSAVPSTTETTSSSAVPSTTETTSSSVVPSTTETTSSSAVPSSTVTTSSSAVPSTTESTSSSAVPSSTVTTSSSAVPSTTETTSSSVVPSSTVTASSSVVPSTTETTSSSAVPSSTETTSSSVVPSSTVTASSSAVPSTTETTSSSVVPSSTVTASSSAVPSTTETTSSSAVPSSTVTTSSSAVPSTTETTSSSAVPSTTETTSSSAVPSSTVTTSSSAVPSTTETTSSSAVPSTTETTSSSVVPSSTVTASSSAVPSTTETTSSSTVPSSTVTASSSAVPSTTETTSSSAVPSTTETTSSSVVPSSTVTASSSAVPSSTVTASSSAVQSSTVTTSSSADPSSTVTARSSTVPSSTSVASSTSVVSSTTAASATTTSPFSITSASPISSTSYSTTTSGSTEFACKSTGYQANPGDCNSFYVCIQGLDGNLVPIHFNCAPSLLWDQNIKSCNYPSQVTCSV